jgi:hypothetical protein
MVEPQELSREEKVWMNRIASDYSRQDELPNPEQVRFDVARLLSIAYGLNDKLVKIIRDKSR